MFLTTSTIGVSRLASSYSSSYDLSRFGDSQGHFMQCTFACKMNSSPCRGLKRQIDAVGLNDSLCVVCLRMRCGVRECRSLVFCLGVFWCMSSKASGIIVSIHADQFVANEGVDGVLK